MIWLSVMFLLFAVAMIVIVWRESSESYVGAICATKYTMAIYYGVIPALLLLTKGYYQANLETWGFRDLDTFIFQKSISSYLLAFLAIAISFFAVTLSQKLISSYISRKRYAFVCDCDKIIVSSTNRAISIASYVTFFLGSISLIVVLVGIGGIMQALKIAETLRGFSANPAEFMSPIVALLRVPAKLILVSSMLFLYQLFGDCKHRRLLFFFFFTSIVFSILYLLLNAGRSTLVIYLFLLLYPFLRSKIKHLWLIVICLAIVGLPFIVILDDVFRSMATKEALQIKFDFSKYAEALRQFSHPIKVLLNVREIVAKYGLLLYKNVVTDVASLLPGVSFDQSFFNTSEFLRGSNWRLLGGIPNDMVSYGYINLRLFGVFLTSFTYGALGTWLDNSISDISNAKQRNLLGILVASSFFGLVINADLQATLQGDVYLMTLVLILLYVVIANALQRKRDKKEHVV